MKTLLKPLVKSVLIPLESTAAAAAADAGVCLKNLWLSNNKSNNIKWGNGRHCENSLEEYLEDSGLLLKGISEKIQYEAKENEGEFLNAVSHIRCKFIRKFVSR